MHTNKEVAQAFIVILEAYLQGTPMKRFDAALVLVGRLLRHGVGDKRAAVRAREIHEEIAALSHTETE